MRSSDPRLYPPRSSPRSAHTMRGANPCGVPSLREPHRRAECSGNLLQTSSTHALTIPPPSGARGCPQSPRSTPRSIGACANAAPFAAQTRRRPLRQRNAILCPYDPRSSGSRPPACVQSPGTLPSPYWRAVCPLRGHPETMRRVAHAAQNHAKTHPKKTAGKFSDDFFRLTCLDTGNVHISTFSLPHHPRSQMP